MATELKVELIYPILATLVAAVILALAIAFWRRLTKKDRARNGLSFEVTRMIEDHWEIAFTENTNDFDAVDKKPMAPQDAYFKLISLGGIDVGTTKIRISLRGTHEETVLIRNIEILARKTLPIFASRVSCPTAGANEVIILLADFDVAPTEIWEAEEKDFEIRPLGIRPYFSRNSITLKKGEIQDLIVVGKTSKHFVEWKLKVTFHVDGIQIERIVDENGNPFKTTGEPTGGFQNRLEWAWYDGYAIKPEEVWE